MEPTTYKPHLSESVIATFNKPVLFQRSNEEVWMFNPKRRYVLNNKMLEIVKDHVESVSDLRSSRSYNPLVCGNNIIGKSILIERYRDRGIGDLLFLTGPLSYMHHITGGNVDFSIYTLAERGAILNKHPAIKLGSPLAGPLMYSDFQSHDYHWILDTVTEYDSEHDQLNVYDALFKSLGFSPEDIEPKWKVPSAVVLDEDISQLDALMKWYFDSSQIDLRRSSYYVVAPFSNGSLRTLPFGTWLDVIARLSTSRPVVIIGSITDRMPEPDMSVGEFMSQLEQIPNVCNVTGNTSIRLALALVSRAECVVCLDSGPLYLAQSVRTPAVSIWGTHDPGVRIGYDPSYMELAVHTSQACNNSPCYAYNNFPQHKCPKGPMQKVCEVLDMTSADDIMERVNHAESLKAAPLGAFKAKSNV